MKRCIISSLALAVFCMGFMIADSAYACLQLPPHPPDVTVSGDGCVDPFLTVTLHDYSTFAASNDFCACALNIPAAIGNVLGAQVVESGTGVLVGSFTFAADPDVDFGFGSTAWQGFSSFVGSITGLLPVDLVFQVDVSAEIQCSDAANQLADALANPPGGVIVGTAGATPEGVPDHHIGVSEAGVITVEDPTAREGQICGIKYQDRDLDGIQDADEPGLGGWEIVLTDAAGNIQVTTTDGAGNYCFTGLPSGTYTVQEISQKGWLQTAPSASSHQVALRPGEQRLEVDFGNSCCRSGPRPDLQLSLNTGFDQATSNLITPGQLDDDWVIVRDDGGGPVPRPASVVNSGPLPAPLAGSRWITAVASGANPGQPVPAPSIYVYRYCFCLDRRFSEPSLNLQLEADDTVDRVTLNGLPLFIGPGGEFTGPPLQLSADPDFFRPGRNCLRVRVRDNFRVATAFTLTGTVSATQGFCCGRIGPPRR